MTRYTFKRGPAHTVGAKGKSVKKGETIELTQGEVIDLTHRGFVFEPEKKSELPEKVKEAFEETEVMPEK